MNVCIYTKFFKTSLLVMLCAQSHKPCVQHFLFPTYPSTLSVQGCGLDAYFSNWFYITAPFFISRDGSNSFSAWFLQRMPGAGRSKAWRFQTAAEQLAAMRSLRLEWNRVWRVEQPNPGMLTNDTSKKKLPSHYKVVTS